jgi:glycosyltransferase involved in cell wall biosynthesis
MPNRNHAKELQISLAAVVAQTRPFDEIVVIDDASTDDSLGVLNDWAARHPAIRILQNARQLGVAGAVNRGIACATGTHIVLASADERVRPELCATLAAVAETNPDLRLIASVYGEWNPSNDSIVVHDRSSELGPWFVPGEETIRVDPGQMHALLSKGFVWLSANTAMFRKDALVEVGMFDPALRWHSDWFAIYAIAFRYGFAMVPKSLALFRVVETSYSAKGMASRAGQREVVLALQDKLASPQFADIRMAIARSPAAMSPFIRPTIFALLRRPAYYGMLTAIMRWWLGEFVRMRRPGKMLRLRRRVIGDRFHAQAAAGDAVHAN